MNLESRFAIRIPPLRVICRGKTARRPQVSSNTNRCLAPGNIAWRTSDVSSVRLAVRSVPFDILESRRFSRTPNSCNRTAYDICCNVIKKKISHKHRKVYVAHLISSVGQTSYFKSKAVKSVSPWSEKYKKVLNAICSFPQLVSHIHARRRDIPFRFIVCQVPFRNATNSLGSQRSR